MVEFLQTKTGPSRERCERIMRMTPFVVGNVLDGFAEQPGVQD